MQLIKRKHFNSSHCVLACSTTNFRSTVFQATYLLILEEQTCPRCATNKNNIAKKFVNILLKIKSFVNNVWYVIYNRGMEAKSAQV